MLYISCVNKTLCTSGEKTSDNGKFAAKNKQEIQPTKARVWLPFPAIFPSQPHTCFFC